MPDVEERIDIFLLKVAAADQTRIGLREVMLEFLKFGAELASKEEVNTKLPAPTKTARVFYTLERLNQQAVSMNNNTPADSNNPLVTLTPKRIASEWKELSAEQKQKYRTLAANDEQRYEQELKQWKMNNKT